MANFSLFLHVITISFLFLLTSHRPVDSGNEKYISTSEYVSLIFEFSGHFPVIVYWPFSEQLSPFMLLIVITGNEFNFSKLLLSEKSIIFIDASETLKFAFSINDISFTPSSSICNDRGVP